MKNKWIIIAVAAILVVLGVAFLLLSGKNAPENIEPPKMTEKQRKLEAFKKKNVIEHKVMLKTLPRFKVRKERRK